MELSIILSLKYVCIGILLLCVTSSTLCFTSHHHQIIHKPFILSRTSTSTSNFTKLYIQPDIEGETNPLVASPNTKPQGYMSSDLSSNEDGKQGRVFGYILFALVPVLFLVPFFLSRGFDPPVDPDITPTATTSTTLNKMMI